MGTDGLLTAEQPEQMFFKCGGIELRRPVQITKLDLLKVSDVDDTRSEEIDIENRAPPMRISRLFQINYIIVIFWRREVLPKIWPPLKKLVIE